MTEPTLARARAGDEGAFAALTDPYRRELQLHCYRMLGSLQDAEDALQETLVSAWRGLERFEERASLRAWLYRIATNRCLNLLRDSGRRPQSRPLPFDPPPPTRYGELPWLQPYPDVLLDDAPGPEARYETREAIGLAYITALQRLPERQRAVLVLRDALGFSAAEVAGMLDTSEPSVNSALQRARSALEARLPPARERAPAPGSARERELVTGFADAFEAGDIERVVALLTDDAWVTMPPEPHEYQGREAIADFLHHASAAARRRGRRRTILVPTRANGQPALAQYFQEAGAPAARAAGVIVLTLEPGGISRLTRFDGGHLVSRFGLPETVTDDRSGGTAAPPAGSR
ncbi:MAG TPA: sigma-70 family RNA polymerase sigma factor [Solirubrobacteraceae bacterium]|jgi:RNA polymerase sigma-70 factor (ECF subfamily)